MPGRTAVAEGQYAAVAINSDLIDDDVAQAVATYRKTTTVTART